MCASHPFPAPGPKAELEEGAVLSPRFGADGLITCVTTDAATGELLMVAHMNAEAIERTQATGQAHFWSRSRGQLWRKGETSGNGLTVVEMRVDCDQDALLLRVKPAGPACHTGRRSCFYRRVEADGSLTIGVTDHAQEALGDVVFLELPEAGRAVTAGEAVAVIESVKAASDIYAPISGEVLAVNEALADAPEQVNGEPYAAWFFKLQPSNPAELEALLDAAGYQAVCSADA